MSQSDRELGLLRRITPVLNVRLGSSVNVWSFTASFTDAGDWFARMEYTLEDEDPQKKMKGLLLQGFDASSEFSMSSMRPRTFLVLPSVIRLRDGLLELELCGPDLEERTV